jgi:chromosome partitioning protein
MTRILAIANQKGGVGKTTTAINLASALSLLNQSVLLIDMDPQGNASSGMGYPKTSVRTGIAHVLMDFVSLPEATYPIHQHHYPSLHLAPASQDLVGLTRELMLMPQPPRPEFRLKEALRKHGQDYDYILIDCPPALNALTLNALSAAHGVLVPVQAEFFALEGIRDLLQTIHQVRKGLNPHLLLAGVVMTMVNMQTRFNQEVVHQVQEVFGDDYIFEAMPPRNIQLSEAPSHGMPIHVYAPESPGALSYMAVARELLFRDGRIDSLDETPSLPSGKVDPNTGGLQPQKRSPTLKQDRIKEKKSL